MQVQKKIDSLKEKKSEEKQQLKHTIANFLPTR